MSMYGSHTVLLSDCQSSNVDSICTVTINTLSRSSAIQFLNANNNHFIFVAVQFCQLYSTLTARMVVLINISNASGKSIDTQINCDELMKSITGVL